MGTKRKPDPTRQKTAGRIDPSVKARAAAAEKFNAERAEKLAAAKLKLEPAREQLRNIIDDHVRRREAAQADFRSVGRITCAASTAHLAARAVHAKYPWLSASVDYGTDDGEAIIRVSTRGGLDGHTDTTVNARDLLKQNVPDWGEDHHIGNMKLAGERLSKPWPDAAVVVGYVLGFSEGAKVRPSHPFFGPFEVRG